MYLEGHGHKAIDHQLNSQGAVSPLGKGWDTDSINYILRNETYLGKRIYGKTKKIKQENGKYTFRSISREKWVFKENAHEAIIPQDLWDKVQATRNSRICLHQRFESDLELPLSKSSDLFSTTCFRQGPEGKQKRTMPQAVPRPRYMGRVPAGEHIGS